MRLDTVNEFTIPISDTVNHLTQGVDAWQMCWNFCMRGIHVTLNQWLHYYVSYGSC